MPETTSAAAAAVREHSRWRRIADWLSTPPVHSTIRPTYLVAEGEWGPSGAKLTPNEVTNVIDQVLDAAGSPLAGGLVDA